MNRSSERDPLTTITAYGTLVDRDYVLVELRRVSTSTISTNASSAATSRARRRNDLPADLSVARSLVPAGTATLRDFSYIAPEIPEYIRDNCTGCMDCVTRVSRHGHSRQSPRRSRSWKQNWPTIDDRRGSPRLRSTVVQDPQVLRRAARRKRQEGRASSRSSSTPASARAVRSASRSATTIALQDDPQDRTTSWTDIRKAIASSRRSGPRNEEYINDKLLIDMMLKEQTHIYVGGAGSCAGCGEGTALRMMCAATGAKYGDELGHRRRHRLQHGLHVDLSVQSLSRSLDEFAVRERPDRRHGRPVTVGSDGLGRQAAVVHRRRRRDVRHRLPVAVAHARLRA